MNKNMIFKGRIWLFDDAVDTDQILPGYAMAYPQDELKKYAMAGSAMPDFSQKVQVGDIIVAGNNFGCGSSREQAPVSLKSAGVSLIIAPTFARIFRRNAINIGLAVMQADLTTLVKTGDIITVDLKSGSVELPDGNVVSGHVPGENILAILAAGGLINKVRQQLTKQEV
ncbi:MAG: dmdB 1 [Firmicutes bacterium]|nr:dmdB 1 [Bacillota bacterium]